MTLEWAKSGIVGWVWVWRWSARYSWYFKLSLYYKIEFNSLLLNTKSFWIYKTVLKIVNECTILFQTFFPSFLLVTTFPKFSQNIFEKRQVAACCFSKEFCANLRSSSTNRRRKSAHFCLQKSSVNSKGSGGKWLRT